MANRVVLGNIGGGVMGLKVSKPGYDVLTAKTEHLLYDNAFGSLRVHMYVGITFSAGESGTKTVAHGLGFVPLVWAIPTVSSDYYVDATHIRLSVTGTVTTPFTRWFAVLLERAV